MRQVPFAYREALEAEIEQLLRDDVIEKIDASEWVSPVVIVGKPNGRIRLCVDLVKANKAVVPDRFPLPNIEDLLTQMRGAAVISLLDMPKAYHQMPLHPEARPLTTFITHLRSLSL